MKNILLLVHDDDGQEARLQAALDLTRTVSGHLTCLDVTPPLLIADEYRLGFGERAVISDESANEAENKVTVTARLAREDVSWDWLDSYGEVAACVLEAAALADIVVLSQNLDTHLIPDMQGATSKILMHARTPIVAVPETQRRFDLAGKALIAWDGQDASIVTIKSCIPLLALAREVEIFAVRDEAMKTEADDGARYLSRHGIQADVQVVRRGSDSVSHLILAEAEAKGAAYVLMGAYNHGPLRETFGGTTKEMLRNGTFPLVLGH